MTTSLPVHDALTGEPAEVWPNRKWVLLGTGTGEDVWLTPTAARQLAAQLIDAATATEGEQ